MNSDNEKKLERRIATAAEAVLAERRFVTPIDVLVGIDWLPATQVEHWRRGRVPYLERGIVANLTKLGTALRVFRRWAEARGLRSSETVYTTWTPDRRRLRFTKTGDPNIERAYRTHWIQQEP